VRTNLKHRRLVALIGVSLLSVLVSPWPTLNPLQERREGALRKGLFTLREQVDKYTFDKRKAPRSLEELVSAGYLKEIPLEPFTNSRDMWVTVQEDLLDPGISDVHSGSNLVGSDGTPYSSW
jgi:general secretion pathway protein G